MKIKLMLLFTKIRITKFNQLQTIFVSASRSISSLSLFDTTDLSPTLKIKGLHKCNPFLFYHCNTFVTQILKKEAVFFRPFNFNLLNDEIVNLSGIIPSSFSTSILYDFAAANENNFGVRVFFYTTNQIFVGIIH